MANNSGVLPKHVEMFKYLEAVFMSNGKKEAQLDPNIAWHQHSISRKAEADKKKMYVG